MKNIILIVTTLLIYSCAKEQFHANNTVTSTKAESQQSFSQSACAKSTLIRPPVDMLILWDNSTSSVFLNNQAKAGLTSIIDYISDRFDYNVMIAPLVASGNNEAIFFSRSGITPSNVITVNKSTASSRISQFSKAMGSFENGAQRAVDLLKNNQGNGVFRKNAYTIVVSISNDDDNSYSEGDFNFSPQKRDRYVKAKSHDLMCLRGNYASSSSGLYDSTYSTFNSSCSNAPKLNSLMMRFLSISALRDQNSCSISSQLTENYVYKNISNRVYSQPYTNGFTFFPAVVSSPYEGPDAFDICSGNYPRVFDSINNVIKDAVLAHEYNYWPVAATNIEVDKNTMTVTKSDGSTHSILDDSMTITRDPNGTNDRDQNGNRVNGFRFLTGNNYLNSRYAPTPGEPITGQVIELFGDAKVRFPECLLVQYSDEIKYYGYYMLADRPDESDITITINGQNIPKSSTNGWTLVKEGSSPKYLSNFNIRVSGPGSSTSKTPAVNQSGYFLKLNGNAVYKSGDIVDVNYARSAQ